MKQKSIYYRGIEIYHYKYGNRNYYYPAFNCNFEVRGFNIRKLFSYIRSAIYTEKLMMQTCPEFYINI